MKTAIVVLKGTSPYSQTRFHNTPKLAGESHDDYRKRTWREFAHFDKHGQLFIPPMAFKNALTAAAKYMGRKIPGKGNATWTKKFEAGILVTETIGLGVHKDKLEPIDLFLPSDGVRGSGSRVMKTYPTLPEWKGTATFTILDDSIDEQTFIDHLREAGKFIGIGFFRPERNGHWGRFEVVSHKWKPS